MAILSGRVGNNGLAYIHNVTKVRRARERNMCLVDVKEEGIVNIEDKVYPVEFIHTNNHRLLHSFEAIGRALYFDEFNKILDGKCQIISDMFVDYSRLNEENEMSKWISLLKAEQLHWGTELNGENLKVFGYQFSPIDGFGAGAIYLRFYETTEVYVVFKENIEKNMSKEEKKNYDKALEFVKNFSKMI